MRRAALVSTALVLLLASASGTTWGSSSSERYLVGYDPQDQDAAHLAIQAAGGSVSRHSPELGFAVVHSSQEHFAEVVALSPHIDYVEGDDETRLDGAQWNGAQWNGAQWNGAQWNGAQWNGAQWNGAQWNGKDGDSEAQRDASRWTIQQFDASSGVKLRYDSSTTDPGLVWQWGTWATSTVDAWSVHTGGDVRLCVLDSGVAWDHPDIAPNHLASWNAMSPTASAYDDGGHGTHIAGIAAGALGNGFGMAGVGNAQILSAKVLDAEGSGHESDLAFGLVWCAEQGAQVAVMALSVTEADHPTLMRALDHAAARDVLLLASAGNAGPCDDCVAFPARHPSVLAVAALDGELAHAPFSSRGPEVAFAAPGVNVLGPLPGDTFAFGSGTSQAVAFAAGVAALVRDAQPALSAAQASEALRLSTRDLGPTGSDPSFGAGLADAERALQQAV